MHAEELLHVLWKQMHIRFKLQGTTCCARLNKKAPQQCGAFYLWQFYI